MLNDPSTNADLWTLTLDGRDLQPFRKTPATERQGSFSPDGKYIAYSSDESGRAEVYVESASGSGARWQISTTGGEQPRWSRKGNEIFYRTGNEVMSVTVQASPFSAAKPVELFDANYDHGGAVPGYDVAPDAQRFLMTAPERPNPTEIHVVIGWPEELKRRSSAPRASSCVSCGKFTLRSTRSARPPGRSAQQPCDAFRDLGGGPVAADHRCGRWIGAGAAAASRATRTGGWACVSFWQNSTASRLGGSSAATTTKS